MIYDKIKSLIGKQVTAIGSCGMTKNNSVEGLLSLDNNDWVVNVKKSDGWELPCSVYYQTIKEL
jgi:hypothetical protein